MSDGPRRGSRRTDTRDPRRARQRALKLLFQADLRGQDPAAFLAAVVDDPRAWAMLDDLDPEAVATDSDAIDVASADADPEPHLTAARASQVPPLDAFTRSLVLGVAEHLADLDALIQRYARRWTVARMPVIDRNVLRLGTYELRHETTSPAVVINECLELAKALSTDDSGRYVNGVLEAVRKHLEAEPVTDPSAEEGPVEAGPVEEAPMEEATLVEAEAPPEDLPETEHDPDGDEDDHPDRDGDEDDDPDEDEEADGDEPPVPDLPAVPVHEDRDDDPAQGRLF